MGKEGRVSTRRVIILEKKWRWELFLINYLTLLPEQSDKAIEQGMLYLLLFILDTLSFKQCGGMGVKARDTGYGIRVYLHTVTTVY